MNEDFSVNERSDAVDTPDRRGQNRWIGGAILIAIGLIFLIQNLTGEFVFRNWWAIFIALPGIAALANAWRAYQARGRLTREARGSLFGGLFMLTLAAVFIFELNWGAIWPVFLIIWGVGLLFDSAAR